MTGLVRNRRVHLTTLEETRAANSRNERNRRRSRSHLVESIKLTAGCSDCGYNDSPAALQFDHARGERHFYLANAYQASYERIWAELAKCDVVCANCHCIRTHARRGSNSDD